MARRLLRKQPELKLGEALWLVLNREWPERAAALSSTTITDDQIPAFEKAVLGG